MEGDIIMSEKKLCSYPGCGRESWKTEDDHEPLCIFHSDDVKNKEIQFISVWDNFLKETRHFSDLNCAGFIFPVEIDLSHNIFEGYLNFSNAVFFNKFYLNNSTLNGNTIFLKSIFHKETFFDESVFSCFINFTDSIFKENVSFRECLFQQKISFENANFEKSCSFFGVDFSKTKLSASSFKNCSFQNVKYNLKPIKWEKPDKYWQIWKYHRLEKPIPPANFTGIETSGILSASNRQFVRDIEDQQFLNQFKEKHPALFFWWLITCDCGRSFLRLFGWCFGISIVFGFLYQIFGSDWFYNSDLTLSTYYFYSFFTFFSLGFGDMYPKITSFWGQFTVLTEVILGYLGLGALITILSNKLTRRS
jgi:uncharacterized protein YjbI with pentapeptide repeats